MPKLKDKGAYYLNIDENAVSKFELPLFKILDRNKKQFQLELRSGNEEQPLLIKVETEININKSRQTKFFETAVTVNEEQVASQFVEGIVKNLAAKTIFTYGRKVTDF